MENNNSNKKPVYKMWWIWLVVIIVIIVIIYLIITNNNNKNEQNSVNEIAQNTNNGNSTSQNTATNTDNFFISGDVFSYPIEKSGYSYKVSMQTWVGYQGDNTARVHPACQKYATGSDAIIPASSNKDCIIPFVMVFQNTTQSEEFSTKLSYRTGASSSSILGQSSNVYVYDSNSGWKVMSGGEFWNFTDKYKGFVGVQFGYIKISDYYSPAYPNGDVSRIYEKNDTLGTQKYATFNIMTQLGNNNDTFDVSNYTIGQFQIIKKEQGLKIQAEKEPIIPYTE